MTRIGSKAGLKNLYMKDDGLIPTGTFKARGMASAISKGAATYACLTQLKESGLLDRDERALLYNTRLGILYPNTVEAATEVESHKCAMKGRLAGVSPLPRGGA